MSKIKVVRSVLFVLVITVAVLSLLQVSVDASVKGNTVTYKELAACAGLSCNDPSDCGSFCFCNNPLDKVGSCFKDEATIESFLRAQKLSSSSKSSKPTQQR
jgi:hypothetical protein